MCLRGKNNNRAGAKKRNLTADAGVGFGRTTECMCTREEKKPPQLRWRQEDEESPEQQAQEKVGFPASAARCNLSLSLPLSPGLPHICERTSRVQTSEGSNTETKTERRKAGEGQGRKGSFLTSRDQSLLVAVQVQYQFLHDRFCISDEGGRKQTTGWAGVLFSPPCPATTARENPSPRPPAQEGP